MMEGSVSTARDGSVPVRSSDHALASTSSGAEENMHAKTVPPPGLAPEWGAHDTRPVSETMPLIGADRATAGGRRNRVRSSGGGGGGLPVPPEPSETSTSMQYESLQSNYQDPDRDHTRWTRTVLILLPVAAVVGAIGVVTWAAIEERPEPEAVRFEGAVSVDRVMTHLNQFMEIARRDPTGSRSILNGYDASALYVEGKINATNYFTVRRQYFMAPVWTQEVPAEFELGLNGQGGDWVRVPTVIPLHPVSGAEAQALRYSGITDGAVTADVEFISSDTCLVTDFAPAAGKAALVLSNFSTGCDYFNVSKAAQEAGVAALLVARSTAGASLPGGRVRDIEWTVDSFNITIPCIGLSYTLGELLRASPNSAVRLAVEADLTIARTFNVIAEVTGSDLVEEKVVVGAHLDSVEDGPGINDNGSGSASLLEMAMQFAALKIKPRRTTQFVWWGAEEVGLLGSRHYVRTLTTEQADNISATLNFDMLGSPNYARMVYDGSGCPPESRDSCLVLQKMFEDYFKSKDLEYQLEPFSTTGGSDYFPFLALGVPAGSIATGASSIKTSAMRDKYGGICEAALDPCYHNACDTVANINVDVLGEMLEAAATVTIQTVNYAGDLR